MKNIPSYLGYMFLGLLCVNIVIGLLLFISWGVGNANVIYYGIRIMGCMGGAYVLYKIGLWAETTLNLNK